MRADRLDPPRRSYERAAGRGATWAKQRAWGLSACGWAPDAGNRGDGVGVAEVSAEPEPVFHGAQQAVVVVGLRVGAGDGEWADDRADDVAAGAESVLGRDPAGALVLVVDHDDYPVAAERGGGLDLGYFLREEV